MVVPSVWLEEYVLRIGDDMGVGVPKDSCGAMLRPHCDRDPRCGWEVCDKCEIVTDGDNRIAVWKPPAR